MTFQGGVTWETTHLPPPCTNQSREMSENVQINTTVYIFDMFTHLTCLMVFTGLACLMVFYITQNRENVEIWTYSKTN